LPVRVVFDHHVDREIPEYVVGVATRHLRELTERDLVALGDLRNPLRGLVVQAHLLLIDEHQQQGGDVGDRHRAIPEVHVGGGGNTGHRLAIRLGVDLLASDGDPHDGGPQVEGLHLILHDRVDGGRLCRVRRRNRSVRRCLGRKRAGAGAAGVKQPATGAEGDDPGSGGRPPGQKRTSVDAVRHVPP
jgi:hypothetical protein